MTAAQPRGARSYAFVTGYKKSGTTWLSNILAGHPQVAVCPIELWLVGHELSVAGDVLTANTAQWIDRISLHGRLYDLSNAAPMFERRFRSAMIASVLSLFDHENCRVIVDKTPIYTLRAFRQIREALGAVPFVVITRNVLDVIVSNQVHDLRLRDFSLFADASEAELRYRKYIQGDAEADVPLVHDESLAAYARLWSECCGHVADMRAEGARLFEVRFEDLVDAPDCWVERLYRFLDVDADAALVRQAVAAAAFEARSGRARGEEDRISFYRKGAVGDWRHHLSESQRSCVIEIAGPHMRQYGYL
jgi:hypothetical protein